MALVDRESPASTDAATWMGCDVMGCNVMGCNVDGATLVLAASTLALTARA